MVQPTPLVSLRFLPWTLAVLAAAAGAQIVRERPEDRPGPVAPHDRSGPALASVSRGPFVSVQVNVDASGNNIRGDAGNEPSLAIDPTDPRKIVIGWRQFDTITSNFRQNGLGWSHDGGATWTFPGAVEPRVFNSDPVLEADAQGTFYYLSYPSGRVVKVFRSTTGGKTWTAPTNAAGGDKPWMVVDNTTSTGKGHIYVIWQVAHGPNTFIRSTDGGLSFSAAVAVPGTPTFGTLAIDTAGNVYAAGLRAQNFGSFVLAKSTDAKDSLRTPTFQTVDVNMGGAMAFSATPNPGGLLGQAQVACDPTRTGYVYMLCSVDPAGADPLDVHLARSTDGGLTFAPPVRINDDPAAANAWQWFGTMSVSPNGRIDVVWNDTRGGDPTTCETYYAYSFDAGATWSKNVPVSPAWNSVIGWPNQNKIGDYYQLRSDSARASLAYAATFNGEQDVYFLLLGDCNKNGVHDGLDIKNGTSFDSNGNTIPDECELCQKSLGFGNGLGLSLCGDDLTTARSVATLLVAGGPAQSPVVVALSLKKLTPPIPLPGGGALLPDLFQAPSILYVPGVTDGTGRLGLPWRGGAASPFSLFVQAVMVQGQQLLVSNALEARLGS